MAILSLCLHMVEEARELPLIRASCYDLITSARPSPNTVILEIKFQHINLEEQRYMKIRKLALCFPHYINAPTLIFLKTSQCTKTTWGYCQVESEFRRSGMRPETLGSLKPSKCCWCSCLVDPGGTARLWRLLASTNSSEV